MRNNLTVEMPEEDLIAVIREVRKLHRIGVTVSLYYCDIGLSVDFPVPYRKRFILGPERINYKRRYLECMDTMKRIQQEQENE